MVRTKPRVHLTYNISKFLSLKVQKIYWKFFKIKTSWFNFFQTETDSRFWEIHFIVDFEISCLEVQVHKFYKLKYNFIQSPTKKHSPCEQNFLKPKSPKWTSFVNYKISKFTFKAVYQYWKLTLELKPL